MEWETVAKALSTAVATGGGTGLVLLAGGRWVAGRWEERTERRWNERFQRGLEALRSDRALSGDVLGLAATTGSTVFQAAQEHRIRAINTLWEELLAVRDQCGATLQPYAILTRQEIESLPVDHDMLAPAPKSTGEVMRTGLGLISEAEQHRPFTGEKLWLLFWTYRAVSYRMVWRVARGIESGHLPQWDISSTGSPDGVVQLLETVLTPEELADVRSRDLGGLQHGLRLIEQKVLAEMAAWIVGDHASDESLRQARRIAEQLGRTDALVHPKGASN